jgi:biopolymer transport protein ExbD
MAMSLGGSRGNIAEINVTPMIDILLVLLIIFMVIVPVTPKGLRALLPQPPRVQVPQTPESTIVVQAFYHSGGSPTYKINDTAVTHAQLLPRLAEIFANRADRVMFVRGDDGVSFACIADIINIGRQANVEQVGLMTPGVQVRD